MDFKAKLQRINELAQKAKNEELSVEEKQEQRTLRQEYVKSFRKSFTNQLHSVKIVDEEGHDVTPEKLKREQNKNNKH